MSYISPSWAKFLDGYRCNNPEALRLMDLAEKELARLYLAGAGCIHTCELSSKLHAFLEFNKELRTTKAEFKEEGQEWPGRW